MKRISWAFALAVLSGACATAPVAPRSDTVETLADEYLAGFAKVAATAPDRLRDDTPAANEVWQRTLNDLWSRLQSIDEPAIGTRDWLTWVHLRERVETQRGIRVCRRELWYVDQEEGWHVQFERLAAAQPVGTTKSRQDAVARWSALPGYIDQEIANLREGLRRGYSAPKLNARRVADQIRRMGQPATSPFRAIAMRDGDASFQREIDGLVSQQIEPALRRYREFLSDEYLAAARDSIAVSDLPEGTACYRARLRFVLTEEVDAEDLHRRALQRISALEERSNRLLAERFAGLDRAAALERVRATRFADSDELLRHATATLQRAQAAFPEWFGVRLPRFKLVAQGASEAQAADVIPFDTTRPTERSRPEVERDVVQRAVFPAAFIRAVGASRAADRHPITALNPPFHVTGGAGFTTYGVGLAREMDVYSGDDVELELLVAKVWGTATTALDPAVHVLGWTPQRAKDFLVGLGFRPARADAVIERMGAEPGWMPIYHYGADEIVALRDHAQRELGGRFDARAFHDRVLEDGPLPMWALRAKIAHWIASAKE